MSVSDRGEPAGDVTLPAPHVPAALCPADKLHRNWAKVVQAAYFRSLGATQREAAKAAGCGERTVRGWEADHELWSMALETARELWASEVDAAARGRVLQAIRNEDDTQTARWWLERTDERLAARKQENPILIQVLQYVNQLPPETVEEVVAAGPGRLRELLEDAGYSIS